MATTTATYSGLVVGGVDTSGVFGIANRDLAGLPYIVRYTFDRSRGLTTITPGYSERWSDGPGALGSITVTIGGVEKATPAFNVAAAFTGAGFAASHSAEYIAQANGLFYAHSFQNVSHFFTAPPLLDDLVAPVLGDGGGRGGFFSTDAGTGAAVERAFFVFGAAVTYSVTNAVPEPASWAMMIAGFGLVGAVQRRQVPKATVSARKALTR